MANELKDILEVRRHQHKGEKLLVDLWAETNPIMTRGLQRIYKRTEDWTDKSPAEIYRMGYYRTEKFMDDLRYMGVPVYIRFHNWKVIDASEHGNMMTSGTQWDYCHSDASKQFMNGLTKVSFAPIDIKSLAMLVPILIGVAIGMWYFLGR